MARDPSFELAIFFLDRNDKKKIIITMKVGTIVQVFNVSIKTEIKKRVTN